MSSTDPTTIGVHRALHEALNSAREARHHLDDGDATPDLDDLVELGKLVAALSEAVTAVNAAICGVLLLCFIAARNALVMAEDAGFKTLADPAAMDIQYLQNVLVASRAYLRSHRDAALRFMKAFVEGVAYFKRNKDDSMRILMKKMRIEKGKETYLERSYQLYASQYIENVPAPSVNGAKTVLEFLVKDFPKAKNADPNSFIDNSLIKSLEESGFIKALYQ